MSTPRFDTSAEKTEYLDAMFAGEVSFWGNGGMGVEFSDHNLVAAVMEEGGFGTLAASAIGYNSRHDDIKREANFQRRVELYHAANETEIQRQIALVRERMPYGILGANIMAAMSDFRRMVDAIGRSGGVDILYVGAGLPRELASMMTQYPHMRYAPIVSSDRAAKIMMKSAAGTDRPPDAFYVELPQYAGGHLGAKDVEDALDAEKFAADKLFQKIHTVTPDTPLILAGGVAYRQDIEKAFAMGYKGVAMGTRLLLTQESGLPDSTIKDDYLDPRREAVTGMTSPAGLPSRYLKPIPDDETAGIATEVRQQCVSCIGSDRCKFIKEETRYCIARHLPLTRLGLPDGVLFTGSCIEKIRRDSLYSRNGERYVPTVRETAEFVFEEEYWRSGQISGLKTLLTRLGGTPRSSAVSDAYAVPHGDAGSS